MGSKPKRTKVSVSPKAHAPEPVKAAAPKKSSKKPKAGNSAPAVRVKKTTVRSLGLMAQLREPVLVFSADKWQILACNAAAVQFYGYTEAELLQRDIFSLCPEKHAELVKSKLASKSSRARELIHLNRSGEQLFVNFEPVAVRFADQNAYLCLMHDVSSRSQVMKTLLESDARNREIIENASDIIYTHDLEGNFTSCNHAVRRILGYSLEESVKLNMRHILAEGELERARKNVQLKLVGEKIENPYQLQVLSKDGRQITLELSTRLVYQDGEPIAVQGIARDITDRVQVEEALRESESKFRAVAENAPCAILIYQGTGFRYANPMAAQITGYSVQELLDLKEFWNLTTPEYRDMIRDRARARLNGEAVPENYEFPIVHRSGEQRWMDFTASRLQYGGAPAVVVMIFDISERKRAQEALTRSEQLFRSLVESSSDLISILDPEGKVQYQSPSIQARLGYEPQEVLNRNAFDLVHADDLEAALAGFRQGLVDPNGHDAVELRLLHKDGSYHFFESVSSLLKDADGKPVGLLCSFRDIGDRKQQEVEVRASEERFRQLFERNLAGVFRCTVDGEFLECNNSFAEIFGYSSPDQVLEHNAWEISADPERSTDFVRRLREQRTLLNVEECLRRRDGSEVWVLENVSLATENGREIIEGTLIEITERKHSESHVRASEERYRDLFHRNLAGVYVTTLDGAFVDCNDSLAEIFGYDTREELLREGVSAVYFSMEERRQFLQKLRRLKSLTNHESLCRKRDGSPLWVLENVALFPGKDGEDDTLQGTMIDITERKHAEQAILESESKFRAVADTAASAIYIHDGKRFLYCNRASEVISGFSQQELLKMNPFDIVHADDRTMVWERGQSRTSGETGVDRYEFRILRKDGRTCWLDFSASVIQFGGSSAILGTAFDITERKRAESLHSAMFRIADRANHAEDLGEFFVSIHQIVGELMDARNFFIALHDRPTDRLSFPYFVDEFDPAPAGDFELARGLTRYVLETGKPQLVTPERFQELHRQGHVESVGADCVDWVGVPLKVGEDAFGVIVLQSYTEDIRFSEQELGILNFVSQHIANAIVRKRHQDAIRESESRYRSLVHGAAYGIYRSDAEHRFVEVNPAMLEMLGYSSIDELLSLDIQQDVYADPAERMAMLYELQNSGQLTRYEARWKRKNGKVINVRLSGRAVRDANGAVTGFEKIVEDVTERRALEEQLRQSQKMEAVGRLAGGVAHDFNNLLTVIKGYSELLLEELKGSSNHVEEVEEIRKAADRAATLTRQLLAFSRQQVLAPKVLDLNGVVANMDKLLKRLLGEDIGLFTVLEPVLGRVKADPGQIEQVIMNLAVNARDAMPRGGKLTIETANAQLDETYARDHVGAKAGSYVMLAVSDSGMGMSEQVRDRIFEPFFTTKEMGKGTGLGLSTVYGIVKQSEGYIWVYSEVGVGTAFKVYLPRVDAPVEALPKKQSPGELRGTETVLLVEDEDGVRALVSQVLHKHGYTVLEARNGAEALARCERHKEQIDLLLTDVVLEQMSGRELAEQLAVIRPEMKVLYISGYTDDAIVHHGVLSAGKAFLQKPFTMEALARKIRLVLASEA